jgi:hypothetical protein
VHRRGRGYAPGRWAGREGVAVQQVVQRQAGGALVGDHRGEIAVQDHDVAACQRRRDQGVHVFVAVADQQLGFFVGAEAAGGGGLAQLGAPGAIGRFLAEHHARAGRFQRGGQAAGEGGLAGAVDAFDRDQ